MTNDKLIEKLKKEIEIFKQTGKLPKERDVIRIKKAVYRDELNRLENIPEHKGTISNDAETLKLHKGDFLQRLTDKEEVCYNLHMVGGMTPSEVAKVMNISEPRIYQIIKSIRNKTITFLIEKQND